MKKSLDLISLIKSCSFEVIGCITLFGRVMETTFDTRVEISLLARSGNTKHYVGVKLTLETKVMGHVDIEMILPSMK